jgi:hypothetical protein
MLESSMRNTLVLAGLLALAACSTPPRGDGGGLTAGSATTNTPDRSPSMTPSDPAATSQALAPRDALLAWLDRNGARPDIGAAPTLKLPVTLTWGEHRLTIADTRLGGGDGLAVKLDDSALGIALKDRARNKCPADQPSCRIWIEGRWRGLDGEVGNVAVTRFVGVIADGDAADQVELLPTP